MSVVININGQPYKGALVEIDGELMEYREFIRRQDAEKEAMSPWQHVLNQVDEDALATLDQFMADFQNVAEMLEEAEEQIKYLEGQNMRQAGLIGRLKEMIQKEASI